MVFIIVFVVTHVSCSKLNLHFDLPQQAGLSTSWIFFFIWPHHIFFWDCCRCRFEFKFYNHTKRGSLFHFKIEKVKSYLITDWIYVYIIINDVYNIYHICSFEGSSPSVGAADLSCEMYRWKYTIYKKFKKKCFTYGLRLFCCSLLKPAKNIIFSKKNNPTI